MDFDSLLNSTKKKTARNELHMEDKIRIKDRNGSRHFLNTSKGKTLRECLKIFSIEASDGFVLFFTHLLQPPDLRRPWEGMDSMLCWYRLLGVAGQVAGE